MSGSIIARSVKPDSFTMGNKIKESIGQPVSPMSILLPVSLLIMHSLVSIVRKDLI